MRNFKVGDRVKVIKSRIFWYDSIGKLGVVSKIENGYIRVEFEDGTSDYGRFDDLELVEDDMITKDDLTTGMIVETRDGDLQKVYLGTSKGGILVTEDETWFELESINSDLTAWSLKELDIIKVFKPKSAHKINTFDMDKYKLIWERKEIPPIKKLTVGEIQEILGYEVEIIAD